MLALWFGSPAGLLGGETAPPKKGMKCTETATDKPQACLLNNALPSVSGREREICTTLKQKQCYREIIRTHNVLCLSKIFQLFYLMGSLWRHRELREQILLNYPHFTDQTKENWKSVLCWDRRVELVEIRVELRCSSSWANILSALRANQKKPHTEIESCGPSRWACCQFITLLALLITLTT